MLFQRPVGCRERWLCIVSSLRGIQGSRVLFVGIVAWSSVTPGNQIGEMGLIR